LVIILTIVSEEEIVGWKEELPMPEDQGDLALEPVLAI
jgi:hypothetical protein